MVESIYDNFLALGEGKQERIRTAAMREFGRYGYKKTSVEQIAKKANIAKGMVFHYFGSKQGLFEYLSSYACEVIVKYFGDLEEALGELDFIEQYHYATQTKLKAFLEYPYVFELLTMFFMHPENLEISESIEEKYKRVIDLRSKVFAVMLNSDNTRSFRDDISTDKAKKYIAWLIDGYSQYLIGNLGRKPLADMNLDDYWDEFDEILCDLKRLFCRPE